MITRRDVLKQGSMALMAVVLPEPAMVLAKFDDMDNHNDFDVIIVGGSYAGLSAALALGRALRKVLVIDNGLPCNRQTPYSHNFITQDGKKPDIIAEKARNQVRRYDTVQFRNDLVVGGKATEQGFEIAVAAGSSFHARKLIFATGVRDLMPDIEGFSACWGTSVIHCPYCHGYEVKHEKTGILANGDVAFHYARLIRNWTKDLTIFTNGISTLTSEQARQIAQHQIPVIEKEILRLVHENNQVQQIVFRDGSVFSIKAIYARPPFEQHCRIPEAMGCELTDQGFIRTDAFQKTTVRGVLACGDSTSMMRSVANAVATGNLAGAMVNHELVEEEFN